jgi:hypothetical protein
MNRQLPIIFEVTEPMRRPQQRRSAANRRIGQSDSRQAPCNTNLLLEICGGEESGARRLRDIDLNRVDLHRLGDVLQILSAEFPIGQVKLAFDSDRAPGAKCRCRRDRRFPPAEPRH